MHMRFHLLLVAVLAVTTAHATFAQEAASRPNVVLIITDDMGWADLSSYGATDIKTPNIDSIGRDGIRLTDFYANGVMCTPTRAGLISGRYQQRYALEIPLGHAASPSGHLGLPVTGHSLPQLLKTNGYATALVGKWHLGYKPEFSPRAHGFDYFFGLKSGYHDFYQHNDNAGAPDLFENETPIAVDGYTTDLVTERAVKFITQNAGRPFFIDVAYNAPHWPYQPPGKPSIARDHARHVLPSDPDAGTRADYAAMVERVDRGVGDILGTLARLKLADNTIVIFTNDNGGEWLASNGPLFNRKMTVWEGGIRVPALIRWPGRIPAGKVSDQVGITMDLTATILAASGTRVPADARLEGVNLLPIWAGKAPTTERTLFWRTGFAGFTQRAVRSGDWKLVRDGTGHVFVFNLRSDPGERQDLANRRQDVAQKLWPLVQAWERDVDAEAKAPRTMQPQ